MNIPVLQRRNAFTLEAGKINVVKNEHLNGTINRTYPEFDMNWHSKKHPVKRWVNDAHTRKFHKTHRL